MRLVGTESEIAPPRAPCWIRIVGLVILLIIGLIISPVRVRADEDPGDNYWLRQLHLRHITASETIVSMPLPKPMTPTTVTPTPVSAATAAKPDWIPGLTPLARALLQRSYAVGHDPHLFTVAGDSNSNPDRYLRRVTNGTFDLSGYPDLQPIIDYYSPSFTHISIAVAGGLRAADMFDSERISEIDACFRDEGLFACELRTSHASVVFIQLGTGDKFVWHEFEHNYRAMIDFAVINNVLPILVTKADDLESIQGGASFGYINSVIRTLAAEYQLPLLDMYAATRHLPVILNPALPKRPFTQFGLQDEWGYYFHLSDIGQDRHLLITLQTLASIK